MFLRLAQRITRKLRNKKYIEPEESEIFEYGFFLVISQIVYSTICLLCGIFFCCVIECIIFYISFMVIREYAGGFHASTELRCFLFSTASIISCVAIIKVLNQNNFDTIFMITLFIATWIIVILSPLDTPEKPLTKKERIKFRQKSLIILSILLIICVVSLIKFGYIGYPIGIGIILESFLLLLGKAKKVRLNHISKNN